LARLLPGFRGTDIGIPKGESAALTRPENVNQTVASIAVKEDTVAVRVFDEAFAITNLSHKKFLELSHLHPACCG
jgi:hypothetical protein